MTRHNWSRTRECYSKHVVKRPHDKAATLLGYHKLPNSQLREGEKLTNHSNITWVGSASYQTLKTDTGQQHYLGGVCKLFDPQRRGEKPTNQPNTSSITLNPAEFCQLMARALSQLDTEIYCIVKMKSNVKINTLQSWA